jgi:hypothetical protein
VEARLRLLADVQGGPRNVTLKELETLMTLWGFDSRIMNSGGHGLLFKHKLYPGREFIVTVAKPKKKGSPVLNCYIKNCLGAIDRVIEREATTNA